MKPRGSWCMNFCVWLFLSLASLVAQTVKNLPATWETWVWSLGWEDPWRREWLPIPVFWPGEFHEQRSLAGYSPWGHKESDATETFTFTFLFLIRKFTSLLVIQISQILFPHGHQRNYLKFHSFRSVQFSCLVMSDSLQPHGLQHTRPPCPSPTPGVYSNSCPLSRWCHPTISSSVLPFFSHLQCFPP